MLGIYLFLFRKITSIIPLRKGLDRITRSKIITWLLPYIKTEKIASLDKEIFIQVDIKDYDARTLYLFGIVDPHVVDICRTLLRPGNCFLDIGANYGSVGILCRNYVGFNGEIHLFEPQLNLCQRIKEAKGIDWNRIHLHEIGLLNKDSAIEMYVSDEHSGKASFISPLSLSDSQNTTKLEVRDIATYLPDVIGERQFGVKLDVEGCEDILIPWLVSQKQLNFIVFENIHLKNRTNLFDYIIQHNFTLFGMVNGVFSTKLHTVKSFDTYSKYKDIVAVRILSSDSLSDCFAPKHLSQLLDNALAVIS